MHRVREVVHPDPDRVEVALELLALGRAPPVVALEQDVEAQLLPRVDLVGDDLGVHRVDAAQGPDDLHALGQRDHRSTPLGAEEHLVADHAGDQVVAVVGSVPEHVQVSDVEQVVGTRGIADDGHVSPLVEVGTTITGSR